MEMFDSKQDIDYVAKYIDNAKIAANDYNLSVSAYITAKDNREYVDITRLNAEIATTVDKIDKLRAAIDLIVQEIEG